MKLKIGLHGERRVAKNTRGSAFCGLGAFVGKGHDPEGSRLHGGQSGRDHADSHKKIDPVRLASELEVDMCCGQQRPLLADGRTGIRRAVTS